MNIDKYLMPLSTLPEIELPDKGGFPDRLPWFQNQLGACGAMATARALSNVFGFPVSSLWIFIIASLFEDDFETEGLMAWSIIHTICSVGVIPEWMLVYTDSIDWTNKEALESMLTDEMYEEAAKHRIKGVIRLRNSLDIKKALATWHPVIWGATISRNFRYDEDGYVLLSGVVAGGHMMHMPNYDSNMVYKFKQHDEPHKDFRNIDQTWKIKDELWGDDGKGHISARTLDEEIIVIPGEPGFRLWNDCFALVPYQEDYQNMRKPKKTVKLFIDSHCYEVDQIKMILDVQPYIKNGRTMIPIRALSEGLGYKVDWLQETRDIIITNQWGSIKLKVGSREIHMKSIVQERDWIKSELVMDVPVEIVQGRAFIPVRFVAEKMSCIISWNGTERSVFVEQY